VEEKKDIVEKKSSQKGYCTGDLFIRGLGIRGFDYLWSENKEKPRITRNFISF